MVNAALAGSAGQPLPNPNDSLCELADDAAYEDDISDDSDAKDRLTIPMETDVFGQAVAVILRQWTALSLAVDGGWGGHDSADKRDWLCATVVDVLQGGLDEFGLEELLEQVMEDEFGVLLEDGSAPAVARDCHSVYVAFKGGDAGPAMAVVAGYVSSAADQAARASRTAAAVERNVEGGSEDDDRMGIDGDAPRGPTGERADRARSVPAIDQDGFVLVARRGKNK